MFSADSSIIDNVNAEIDCVEKEALDINEQLFATDELSDHAYIAQKLSNTDNAESIKHQLTNEERGYLACNYANSCDVAAEVAIARLMLPDADITIDASIQYLEEQGVYTPEAGVSLSSVGTLLEHYGIGYNIFPQASVSLLEEQLTAGHGVMIPVDSSELYDKGILAEIKLWLSEVLGIDFGSEQADHVLMVTAIDNSDPANPMVVVYDPLHPDGIGKTYPLNRFLAAWEDSSFRLFSTEAPMPTAMQAPTPQSLTPSPAPHQFFEDGDAIHYL